MSHPPAQGCRGEPGRHARTGLQGPSPCRALRPLSRARPDAQARLGLWGRPGPDDALRRGRLSRPRRWLEKVPRAGPLILAPNHFSFMDHFLVGMFLRRQVQFMAKSQLFKRPMQLVYTHGGVFPVRRGHDDQDAFITAETILARGGCVVMYCEGGRSRTGELAERRQAGHRPARAGDRARPSCPSRSTALSGCATGSGSISPGHRSYGEPIVFDEEPARRGSASRRSPTRSSARSSSSTRRSRTRAATCAHGPAGRGEHAPAAGRLMGLPGRAPQAAPASTVASVTGDRPRIRSAARSATAIVGAFVFPRGTRRHHRGVDDPQPLDAAHAQLEVDHGVLVRAHRARADRVVERLGVARGCGARSPPRRSDAGSCSARRSSGASAGWRLISITSSSPRLHRSPCPLRCRVAVIDERLAGRLGTDQVAARRGCSSA